MRSVSIAAAVMLEFHGLSFGRMRQPACIVPGPAVVPLEPLPDEPLEPLPEEPDDVPPLALLLEELAAPLSGVLPLHAEQATNAPEITAMATELVVMIRNVS